jgi:hypothetical protein
MERVIRAHATTEAIEHITVSADDVAPWVRQDRAPTDPPGGETTGPYDLDWGTRLDGQNDQLIVGVGYPHGGEQGRSATEGKWLT